MATNKFKRAIRLQKDSAWLYKLSGMYRKKGGVWTNSVAPRVQKDAADTSATARAELGITE